MHKFLTDNASRGAQRAVTRRLDMDTLLNYRREKLMHTGHMDRSRIRTWSKSRLKASWPLLIQDAIMIVLNLWKLNFLLCWYYASVISIYTAITFTRSNVSQRQSRLNQSSRPRLTPNITKNQQSDPCQRIQLTPLYPGSERVGKTNYRWGSRFS